MTTGFADAFRTAAAIRSPPRSLALVALRRRDVAPSGSPSPLELAPLIDASTTIPPPVA